MSNATVSRTAYTRPSDFVTSDVTQNTGTTTTSSLVLNINNSQDANTLDIKNYVVDYKGNDNVTSQDSSVTLTPTTKTSNATNNDVTVTGLLANVTYDLSAHLINNVDLSNSKIGLSATTRPTTFVANDISQNIGSTTQTTLMMKVNNSQVAGSLNINKYSFDVSGNNGTNATSQTIEKTAVNKGPTATNIDVSLNDLSANTLYDLSVNMFNSQDLSSSKVAESGVTRPSEFTTNDVSQNMTTNVVTTDSVTMSVKHKDVEGTLDISGYNLTYSVTGGNTDTGSVTKTATNKGPTASNNDITITGLQYPNSVYNVTTHLFNVYDMSNATVTREAQQDLVILLQMI